MRLVWLCVVVWATASAQFQGEYPGQKVPQINPRLQPTPNRVRVGEAVAERQNVHRVMPVYPNKALAACVQGNVVVRVVVARDGKVSEASVINGPELLAQATVDAVRQWRYEPYLLNGRAVEMDTTTTVRFKLPQGQCVKT
jgi:protein TonB